MKKGNPQPRCLMLKNGESFALDLKTETLKFRCCDCGLVHWMFAKLVEDRILCFHVIRDERATAAVRAWKKRKRR